MSIAVKDAFGRPFELEEPASRIVSLIPSITETLFTVEENRKPDVEAMWAAGLKVLVTYPRTVKEGIQLVRELGVLTATSDRAEEIATACEAEVERAVAGRARVRVFCPIWRGPYMTINHDTYKVLSWYGPRIAESLRTLTSILLTSC